MWALVASNSVSLREKRFVDYDTDSFDFRETQHLHRDELRVRRDGWHVVISWLHNEYIGLMLVCQQIAHLLDLFPREMGFSAQTLCHYHAPETSGAVTTTQGEGYEVHDHRYDAVSVGANGADPGAAVGLVSHEVKTACITKVTPLSLAQSPCRTVSTTFWQT